MNRRDFLNVAAFSGLSFASAAAVTELRAEPRPDPPAGPPVTVGVIGLGDQGRAILTALAKLGPSKAPVAAICDSFTAPILEKRAKEFAPSAVMSNDYRKLLDDKSVQAVFVVTPSHKHKQIVLDALQAGKHVYCEAPLASDLDEAKAIAKAGLDAKTFLMPGLQVRSNAQALHVGHFVKARDFGTIIQGRAHWHRRNSWRLSHPDPAREKELNWRLAAATSSGLIGEIGIHQIDTATMYIGATPLSVTGFGSIVEYKDGRDVADSAQCIVEYPKGVTFYFDASLISSFENKGNIGYEVFYGAGGTFLMRDQRAWMFKEPDANNLGWEGFARKDVLKAGEPDNGTGEAIGIGIALVADASKQLALGKEPGKMGTDVSKTSLYQSVEAFVTGVSQNKRPAVGPKEGYHATVIAHKSNEASVGKKRIEFTEEMFAL